MKTAFNYKQVNNIKIYSLWTGKNKMGRKKKVPFFSSFPFLNFFRPVHRLKNISILMASYQANNGLDNRLCSKHRFFKFASKCLYFMLFTYLSLYYGTKHSKKIF